MEVKNTKKYRGKKIKNSMNLEAGDLKLEGNLRRDEEDNPVENNGKK